MMGTYVTKSDDRVVLPLRKAEQVAASYCDAICVRQGNRVTHSSVCLVPHLEERQRLLDDAPALTVVSGDCQVGKHDPVCSGCACRCHKHSSRGSAA